MLGGGQDQPVGKTAQDDQRVLDQASRRREGGRLFLGADHAAHEDIAGLAEQPVERRAIATARRGRRRPSANSRVA